MTTGKLFEPGHLDISRMRYRWMGSEMIFGEGDDDAVRIVAREAPDGGLVWDDGAASASRTTSGETWQTVWTVTTEAEFEDRSLLVIMTSGSAMLPGPWLARCRGFIEGLSATVQSVMEYLAKALSSDKESTIGFLIEDMRAQLPPAQWEAMFPGKTDASSLGAGHLAGALKITGIGFATPDAPRDYVSLASDMATVDLRLLCPAAAAAAEMDNDGYLKFGSGVDITGQVLALRIGLDGRIDGLAVES
jgi:hypothetical protein